MSQTASALHLQPIKSRGQAADAHLGFAIVALALLGVPFGRTGLAASAVACAVVTYVWCTRQKSAGAVPALVTLAVLSGALPVGANALIEAAFAALLALFLVGWRHTRLGSIGVLASILLTMLLLGGLNPNIPSMNVALLGIRKSGLALLGLLLGIAYPWMRGRVAATSAAIAALLALGAQTLAVHWILPGLESSVVRAADSYTGLFGGAIRLQGLLAGPFHASIVGVFLVTEGARRLLQTRRRQARLQGVYTAALLVCGATTVVMAQVRAGYLAAAVCVLLMLLLDPARSLSSRLTRLGVLIIALLVLASFASAARDPATESLSGLTSDSRALGRLDTWSSAAHLTLASPLVGWGPGSAGETLGDEFTVDQQHVTAHSSYLKFGVEAGVLGLVLFCSIILYSLTRLRRHGWLTPGTAALLAVAVMGLTNSTIEAAPVSFALLFIAGLQIGTKDETP